MNERIKKMFLDKELVTKVQNKLPKLFYRAELESSRAGKIGMEVGTLRERILIALLIYYFGEENVETNFPITAPEIDVKLFNNPISIKTLTSNGYSGVKLIWTVDAESALAFRKNYLPKCDMMFVRINWDREGGLFYIPLETQMDLFNQLGRNEYIKLPKAGTNPRGVELSANVLKALLNHTSTSVIRIKWKKEMIEYNPVERWVELWRED